MNFTSLKYLCGWILFLTIISCQKDELSQKIDFDYLLFGHFYGECIGDACIETFKLEKTALYLDTLDNYPSGNEPFTGSFIQLTNHQYLQVKDLPEKLPSDLFEIPAGRIGCPDCADGGGIYIEIKKGEEIDFWLIDQMLQNIPEPLHEFINLVNARIALLQSK